MDLNRKNSIWTRIQRRASLTKEQIMTHNNDLTDAQAEWLAENKETNMN